uniref:RRM domain-containing protein n=1 Tax=Amphimedon queenslandica TaxID=400682 RepID=A0A1X7UE13_AMPQE
MAEKQPISKEEGNWPELLTDRAGDDNQSNGFSAPPPVTNINVPLTEGIEEIDLLAPLPPPPALLDLDITGAQSTFVPPVLSQDDTTLLSNTMNEQNLLTVDSTQSFNLSPSQFSLTGGAGNSLSLSLSQDSYQLQDATAGTTALATDLLSYPNSQSSQTMSDPLTWTRQTEDLSTVLSPTISSQNIPANNTTALRNQEQSHPSVSNPSLLDITSNPPPESIPVSSTLPISTSSIPTAATTSSIVISSLDPSLTDQEIIEHITTASVANIKGLYRSSPTVCTVTFPDMADAFSATVLLNGLEMKGASVQVKLNDTCSPSPSNNYVHQRFDMSRELYQCFGNDAMEDIKRLEQNGGLLTYSPGSLYIEAPSHDLIDSFKRNTIAKYTEKSVVLTEMQWEELMMNDGKNYIELVRPFETNSHIIIFPIRDGACKLLIVGTVVAVESAYTYCWNNLAKDIRVERVKLEALKAFHPTLSNDIFMQYQVELTYSNGGISLNGLSHNVPLARADVEKRLSELVKSALPPFKPILFLSFKRKLSSLNPKTAIISSDGATDYICCRNEESLQEIMKLIRKKKNKEITLSGPEALERVRSKLLTVIQQIEQDCLVDISIKTKNSSIIIHGYVTADLADAKERIQALLKSSEVVRRPLEAPPGIALYVHHCLFKQPTEGTKQLLTGLMSKVTSSEDVVYLEGPCDVVSETEKKLLEYFVTSELECKEFPFSADCRFISHIESEVLRQLHKKKTFTH